MSEQPSFVVTARCADRPGVVAALAGPLAGLAVNIDECQQFGDPATGRFFVRMRVHGPADEEALRAALAPTVAEHGIELGLWPAGQRVRTLVLVSRAGHCLNDLLFRQRTGSLPVEVVGVVSNHTDLAGLAAADGIPFHHVPVSAATKPRAEAELLRLVAEHDAELVVLARYMQVLSDEACRALAGRAINIHHSFLPSFKGARPYHQAHERGVKLIGATAHYVTPDLDEGPIIEQDVARVDHGYSPEAMVVAGRDVEAQVLARAVGWHAQRRVFRNGTGTVVLR